MRFSSERLRDVRLVKKSYANMIKIWKSWKYFGCKIRELVLTEVHILFPSATSCPVSMCKVLWSLQSLAWFITR